jgi:AcrR family transcriptional regulator
MSRKRLSREDSRDLTTRRLLDAAQKLIAKKGLCDTTLEDIAKEAGYTRGAFYSNFNSKDDLFIELLRRDHATTISLLSALHEGSPPLDPIRQHIREIYSRVYPTNESFMNWTEARMLAAQDAKFRVKLDALLVERCAKVSELIEHMLRRIGVEPPLTATVVAMSVNSLFEGVKLTLLSSPGNMAAEERSGTGLVHVRDRKSRTAESQAPREGRRHCPREPHRVPRSHTRTAVQRRGHAIAHGGRVGDG